MLKRDFYEVLGLNRDAKTEDIRAAYKRAAFVYHPDRNPGNAEAERQFKEAAEAHETLADPEKRKVYDMTGGVSLEDVDYVELLSPLFGARARPAAAVLGALVALAERASHATHLADVLYDIGEKGVAAALFEPIEGENHDRMHVRAGLLALLDYMDGGDGDSPLQMPPARAERRRKAKQRR